MKKSWTFRKRTKQKVSKYESRKVNILTIEQMNERYAEIMGKINQLFDQEDILKEETKDE